MEFFNKQQLFRCFFNPNCIYSLFSHSKPFLLSKLLNVSSFCKTINPCFLLPSQSTILQVGSLHAKPTSSPLNCSIPSNGLPPFCSFAKSNCGSSLRPHGHIRLFSVCSSYKNSDFENVDAIGSDDSLLEVSTVDESGSNANGKEIFEIIEAIRHGKDDLESELNAIGACLSVPSVNDIFRVLNCEKVSGVRFFVWARDKNPKLCKKANFHNLIIDNCGWLLDYEVMLALLKEFNLENICLTEKAFGFLPVVDVNKVSIMESTRKVVELLDEAGGSCRATGICGLLTMLSKMDLFEMAQFVIEITERKISYYNILILEKCRKCCLDDVRSLFEEMRQFKCYPDVLSYNYLLSSLCKNDKMDEAFNLLEEMEEKGCNPTALTFEIIILFLCRLGKMDIASQLFGQLMSRGLVPQLPTNAALIKGYFHSEKYEDAYKFVVTLAAEHKCLGNMVYSLLASLHEGKGDLVTAGNILVEMMDKRFIPYIKVYIRIAKRLYKSGRKQMAGDLKIRFSKLRPEYRVVVDLVVPAASWLKCSWKLIQRSKYCGACLVFICFKLAKI